jgi:uncharacterized tellurite resistance protein B-like protein
VRGGRRPGKASLQDLKVDDVAKAGEVSQRATGFLAAFRANLKRELEAVRRAEEAATTTTTTTKRKPS